MHNQYTDFLLRLPDVKTKQVLEILKHALMRQKLLYQLEIHQGFLMIRPGNST